MTLGYSRKAVRLFTWTSSAQTRAELHERSFRRLGGATRVVVLDDLTQGVLTPDVDEPALNPLYREVLAHYGVVGLPCRIRDPDRKGKVEAGIGHTQKTLSRGMRFETVDRPAVRSSSSVNNEWAKRKGRTSAGSWWSRNVAP